MRSRCSGKRKAQSWTRLRSVDRVCGFANSHEGAYLILGATRASDGRSEQKWRLDGVPFPDEPTTWVTNVVGDMERGVRPRPDFDVLPWRRKGICRGSAGGSDLDTTV